MYDWQKGELAFLTDAKKKAAAEKVTLQRVTGNVNEWRRNAEILEGEGVSESKGKESRRKKENAAKAACTAKKRLVNSIVSVL